MSETATPVAPTSYTVANFTRCPCSVSFNGTILGGTDGPVKIKPEITTEDVTCNQASGRTVIKRVTKVKYVVSASFMEPSVALAAVVGMTGTIGKAMIGTDLYTNAQTLILSEIGGTKVYTFPAMVAIVDEYDIDGTKDHAVPITFESVESAEAYLVVSVAESPGEE